jgi:hypothetical protein
VLYLLTGNVENFIIVDIAGRTNRRKTNHVINWDLLTAVLSNIVNGLRIRL